MFEKIKKLLGKEPVDLGPAAPPEGATLGRKMRYLAELQAHRVKTESQADLPFSLAGIARIESWIEGDNERHSEITLQTLCEGWGAALGEILRIRHGGSWDEVGEWGAVIGGLGGLKGLLAFPIQMIEVKYRERSGFRIMTVLRDLLKRIDSERPYAPYLAQPESSLVEFADSLKGKGPLRLQETAMERAARFAEFWRMRRGERIEAIPDTATLLEDLLVANYFVLSLKVETLVDMGCFLGEVLRTAVGGQYAFDPSIGTLLLSAGSSTTKPVDIVFTTYRQRKPVGQMAGLVETFLKSARGRFSA